LAAIPLTVETNLLAADDDPDATGGPIEIPPADEMPGVEDVSPPPQPVPDKPGIDKHVEQEPRGNVGPETETPADDTGDADAPARTTEAPVADEVPDDPPGTTIAPPEPDERPAPAPPATTPADEDVPLWKPGTAETRPAETTDEDATAADQNDNIVLLVDRSASMGGYWAWTSDDVTALIRGLDETQRFDLVLFGQADDIWQIEGKGLDVASLERKIQAIELLTFTRPAGDTDPQAGFQRAIQAIGDQPATIQFVSDGVFNHPLQVRRDLRNMLTDKSIVINTHLYGETYPAAVSMMKAIARDGRGEYVNATQYP
jgi:hypothetical protein